MAVQSQTPVVFVHGNGDHAGLWDNVIWRFESNGYPASRLFAVDLPNPSASSTLTAVELNRSTPEEQTAALAAFAPPGARTVMLVGYGGGGSLYATGLNPAIEHIRVVEIVGPVLTVMDDLARDSRDPVLMRLIEDRRIERIVGDGRHLIFKDQSRFDVLKVETISPRTANSGFLYSLEYFREVRRRLNPGGIVVQWAATERTVATFVAAFPHVLRLGDALIGSEDPIRFDMAAFEAILRGPAAPGLEAAGWSADVILEWLSSRPPRSWTPGDLPMAADINTDLFPRDEYFLNR
jgi:pimeloyl-ACP methyl ester carboxylesterase